MKSQYFAKVIFSFTLAAGLAVTAAGADAPATAPKATYGAIVGKVTNSSKLPVEGVTVAAVRADGGAIRATVSGSDGVYSFADLTPGMWTLTLQVDDFPEIAVPQLQVMVSHATRN